MAEFKLGRLRFVWQGEWTTGTAYVKDDIVRYAGSAYVCVGAHTSAVDFYTNSDAGKWELMSAGIQWKDVPWATGIYYAEGDIVRYGGRVYIAVNGHLATASFDYDFDASQWQLFTDGIEWKTSPWTASGTLYKEGDLVRHGGKVYICINGNTSSSSFETDLVAASWQLFADGVQWKTAPWTATEFYKVSDIVRYGAKTYICVNEHTANNAQDGGFYIDLGTGQWQLYTDGIQYAGAWATAQFYKISDVVRFGGKSYIATAGHLSAADFYIDLDASSWALLNDGQQWQTAVWTAGSYYKEGDLVRNGGKIYIAIDGHTASTGTLSFNTDLSANKWQLFSDGIQWQGPWVTATVYKLGDIASYGGKSYTAVVAHTAAADFNDDLDSAHWQLVADGVEWKAPWTTTVLYKEGDVVRYGGKTYVCTNGHTSDTQIKGGFYTDIANWQLFSDGTVWMGDWTTDIYYKIGDTVRYNGFVYVCKTGHNSSLTTGVTGGLEVDILKWDTLSESFKFRQDWNTTTRYVINDVVKFGGSLYICTAFHLSGANFDESKWSVLLGGLQFEDTWSAVVEYQLGDIVTYGGYTFVAINRNTGNIPPNEPTNWDLLTVGFKILGTWSNSVTYKVGDLVNYGGNQYVAIANSTPGEPPVDPDGSDAVGWQLAVGSFNWRNEWIGATDYRVGDTVRWVANTYRAVKDHISDEINSRPELDITNTYWNLVVAGDEANVLAQRGDMLARGASENRRIIRGLDGQILKMANLDPSWDYFNQIDRVYYVKTDGVDGPERGTTLETAFKTVKYASQFIIANQSARTPATIVVKTGYYYEELPIVIPANVAVVGDELRSTRIVAAPEKGINSITVVTGGTGYSLRPNAEVLLTDNRTFLQTEIVSWIDAQIALGTSYWGNFTFDHALCYRDIGSIVDAVTEDLQFGGNINTIRAARLYWNSNVSKVLGQERQCVDSLNRLKTIVNSYVLTNTLFTPTQNGVVQVTNANTAEVNTAARVTSLIDIITAVITSGLSQLPGAINPTNLVTVEISAPTAPNSTPPVAVATVHNGAVTAITIINQGSGYSGTPTITIVGFGTGARAVTTLNAIPYTLQDMFYMQDGSGLRNCTLAGLSGTLSVANQYLTKRPSAGAYVSLDPGTGPGDETAWVVYRSPYVQNVSTFGDACTGLKIDGALHNGGNKTIVCNDFTQVLNDGIGIWCTNQGRVENVSVFCYYNHIGYLAENGGVIRSTNGNSSYGTYGIVAEGVDSTEVSRTAKVDNRRLEATVINTFTDGSGIIALEYSNAGEGYVAGTTNYTFDGSGVLSSIVVNTPVVRDAAVKEVRVLESGLDWLVVVNNAQSGDATSIRLSASDIQASDAFVGERIVIIDGQGVGQYGYITAFNGGTKVAMVAKESFIPQSITASTSGTNLLTINGTIGLSVNDPVVFNSTAFGGVENGTVYYVKAIVGNTFSVSTTVAGTAVTLTTETGVMSVHKAGWEALDGRAVKVLLDTTTRYTIEPRVVFSTGQQATASAAISKGINAITTVASGSNYQVAPDVIISGTEANSSGATATATIAGGVNSIVVRNGGAGFTSTPTVQFISTSGSGAAATASLVRTIGSVTVTNGGTGYSQSPSVTITGTGYAGDAYVSATITQIVGEVIMEQVGEGYESVPVVLIEGGGGAGASARANLDAVVSGFTLLDGGQGYVSGTTTVTISRAAGDITGAGALAEAIISGTTITGFTLIDAGAHYSAPPIVTITSTGVGVNASAIAKVIGNVASINIENGGTGYLSTPTISIISDTGYGATALAYTTGSVAQLDIVSGGSGFTGPVTLAIVGTSSFTYDEAKFRNDTDMIIRAVTTDMVFGSNAESTTAGLTYLKSYSTIVTPTQKSQTVSAINKARDSALARTANTSAKSRINANFATVTDIITNGYPSVPAIALPTPANTANGIVYGVDLLQANKSFLAAEVVAWVNYTYASLSYTQADLVREVGTVIDAMSFDLMYGGNSLTLSTANGYFFVGDPYLTIGEAESAAAYNHLREIIGDVLQNTTITKSVGNSATQTTNANSASSPAVTTVQGLVDIVIDVVTDGTTVTASVGPTLANGDSILAGIKTTVDAAILTIQNDVIDYIQLTYVGGQDATATATLINSVGYITIDAAGTGYTTAPTVAITGGGGTGSLATAYIAGTVTSITKQLPGSGYVTTPTVAIAGGRNFKSVGAGEAYYKNASSAVARGSLQLTQTLAGVNYITTLITAVGGNSNPATLYQTKISRTAGTNAPTDAITQAALWNSVVKTIIENGNDNANASTVLAGNRAFIQAEINQFIANQGYAYATYLPTVNYSSAVHTTLSVAITTTESGLGTVLSAITNGTVFTANEIGSSTSYAFTATGPAIKTSNTYTIPVSNTVTGTHNLGSVTFRTGAGWTFTTAVVKKNVGVLTDALAYDLANSGVSRTLAIGAQYGKIAASESIANNVLILQKLESLIQDLVLNNTVAVLNYEAATQVFAPLVVAELTAPTAVTNNIALITSLVTLATVTGAAGNTAFANLLVTNKLWMQAEVTEFIKTTYAHFDYNQELCARDVGLIVDAIAYDIVNSTTAFATATATTTNVLASMSVVTGGTGYGAGTTITFAGDLGTGSAPAATPVMTAGVVTGFTITQAGSGFTVAPTPTISAGAGSGAFARAYVLGGLLKEIRIIHPGSGYTGAPYVSLTDPNNTTEPVLSVRIGNGVLDQPTFTSRGTGFLAASTSITGAGFADSFQVGDSIYVKNLTNVPTPGANVQFEGNTNFYKLVSVKQLVGPTGIIGGKNLLAANRQFIQAQTIAYINATFPTLVYNQALCKRDVGYIVDAVVSDAFGDTEKGIEAGKSYYRNLSAIKAITNGLGLANAQKSATLAAIAQIQTYATSVVSNVTIARNQLLELQVKEPSITNGSDVLSAFSTTFGIISDIINNGPTITGVSNLLRSNKPYITAEVIAFIATTYPDFSYSETLCARDVGLIVDAIAYDLYGGLTRSRDAGLRYYSSDSSLIAITTQKPETVAAIARIGILAQAVVANDDPVVTYQITVPRISDNTVAVSYGLDAKIGTCVNALLDIINNGLSALPTGQYTARLQLNPPLTVNDVPADSVGITIRSKYSQVRLTGHDFLNIGTGNKAESNYPGIPVNPVAQENEVIEEGGGRCFYSSTDQDGNFRVGELFKVEQATGVATLNATAFNLSGLNELSLGGITVGGTSVVIKEFSTDSTFLANSDTIVPTQKAIKTFISSQLGSGGGNLAVNAVTAGDIQITAHEISTNAGLLTINSPGGTSIVDTTESNDKDSGAFIVEGGVGIEKSLNVGGALGVTGNVVITGTLTVNGSATTLNAGTLTVDDNNIEINSIASPTDATASGGGITLKGATDKTINWVQSTGYWTANQGFQASSIQNTAIGSTTRSSGAFTTLAADGQVTFNGNVSSGSTGAGTIVVTGGIGVSESINVGGYVAVTSSISSNGITNTGALTSDGANAAISLAPTGTGTVTISPATVGSIDKMNIGATTRGTGAFTTLASNSTVTMTGGTTSTTSTSGQLQVTGGVGISENLNVGGNAIITGNLTVNGTTTTVNSTTITVDDINLELGAVTTPTDTTANGGGIVLKGATDKTILWDSVNTNWTSSEHWNIATGKSFEIANTVVLSATQVLGKSIGGTSAGDIVNLDTAQTLTNKSLSDSTTYFIDETTATKKMQFQLSGITAANTRTLTVQDSDGTIALLANTTYVGTTSIALNRASANLALTGITSVALPGATSGTITLAATATAGTNTLTLPAQTGTLAVVGNTFFVGTTSIANNRTTGALALTGVSIDGSSGSVTNGFYTTSSFSLGTTSITVNRSSAAQSLTGISIDGSSGSSPAGSLTGATLAAGVTASSLTSVGTLGSLSVTGTTSGATYTGTSISIRGNGAGADPYGTIAASNPAGAINYSTWGTTRAGTMGAGHGLTGTTGALGLGENAFWWGSATSGSAGAMSAAWMALNSGNLVISGTLTEQSSIRYKENVTPITGALDKVLQLQGVTYDKKDGSSKNEPGLIAEDVLAIIPEVVMLNQEGTAEGINYTKLTAYLIEAIKALNAEIAVLKGAK